jgi:hypothetical protein
VGEEAGVSGVRGGGTKRALGACVPPTKAGHRKETTMLFAIASLTFAAAVTSAAAEAAPSTDELAVTADLVLASAVVNRRAEPLEGRVLPGQTVYAFTQVRGPGGGYVEHVWTRDGKEVSRQYLPVGQSKRWRTWSKHKVAAGRYHVEVFDQDGTCLQEIDFEVTAPEEE